MDLVDEDEDGSLEAANAFCESQTVKLKPLGLQEKADNSREAFR